MANPMLSAPVSAAQIAQQKIQDQGSQQLKQGASKFDGALAQKAQSAQAPTAASATQKATAAQATQAAQAGQAASKIEHARATEPINHAQKASLRKVDGNEAKAPSRALEEMGFKAEAMGTGKAQGPMMVRLIGDIERGQGVMDKLIQAGLSGKQFSNSELLALQAGMYKFTQELELTGKVVEKATTGLKDTLKTQV